tara:strand:+ start:2169 stop:3044 length:876 start_codon:yes stop_codon:yes gene_type:complete
MDFSNYFEFENLLYELSKKEIKTKKSAQLISPATYIDNCTRANKNVINWAGWAAVDVDDHEFKGDLENELLDRFGNLYYTCYSTASSTKDRPKFRLVFPLTSSVESHKIKHFWYALNTEIGELGDRQTKDLSRMYFIPGSYDGAYNFIFTNKSGNFIDPDVLMNKHPYSEKRDSNNFIDRLPEELQKEIIEYRKQNLDNTSVIWSGYNDCPFFPKKLSNEYRLITNTGWYHKMYQIMVAIASNAMRNKYPITSNQIAELCRQFDLETGNWYENRPLEKEADRALEFVYKNI